ncbi:hypothetical protein ACFE04_013600 [Oxalis oulophora]
MQGLVRVVRSCQETMKLAVLRHCHGRITSSLSLREKGLGNVTVADVLLTKEDDKVDFLLWCRTDDTLEVAAKNMADHNVGSLVVLRPGDQQDIAGIITERDYLRKIVARGRSPNHTRVGDIMTEENKLITVTSNTNILQAMQLMTENQIRHVPVIDRKIVGMVSIVDVVRAVVEQQNGELKRLNGFIQGDYY